jgi:hypothetical protein
LISAENNNCHRLLFGFKTPNSARRLRSARQPVPRFWSDSQTDRSTANEVPKSHYGLIDTATVAFTKDEQFGENGRDKQFDETQLSNLQRKLLGCADVTSSDLTQENSRWWLILGRACSLLYRCELVIK